MSSVACDTFEATASGPSFPPVGLDSLLLRAWKHLRAEQLDHGEFPTFRAGHSFHPYRTCLLSALIHDVSSPLDPRAPAFDHLVLEAVPQFRTDLVRGAMEIRRTIRGFLAWQEDGHGAFQLQGKSSTRGADLATTSLAALALSESANVNPKPQRRRAECIAALARPASDASLAALTNTVRFLARVGQPRAELASELDARVMEWCGSSDSGFRAEACYWALARLFREDASQLPNESWDRVRQLLLATLGDNGARTPLAASLLLLALIDFESDPALLKQPIRELLNSETGSGWPFEPFFEGGYGSPALVTAFALTALLRSTARVFEP